jgi:hypothetical protein
VPLLHALAGDVIEATKPTTSGAAASVNRTVAKDPTVGERSAPGKPGSRSFIGRRR